MDILKIAPFPVKAVLRYAILVGIIYTFVEAERSDDSAPEIFVGASPCGQSVRPMISIPIDSDCELIKWKLSLFKNQENDKPSKFELKYTYGMSKAGTEGFVNDGTSASVGGKWSSQPNIGSLPGQFVIQLQPAQMKSISFAKLHTNMLHLLDSDGKLMIGNAAWGYTLNRAKN